MFEPEAVRYQKFRIPPDFDLAELHGRCCKVFLPSGEPRDICGCCNQRQGQKQVSLCSYVSSLRYIGEEVPIFFKFINVMIFLILIVIFFQAGVYLFECQEQVGQEGTKCQMIEYTIKKNSLSDFQINIWMGYIYSNETLFMIEIITYSVIIFLIKIYLKKKKYDYRSFAFDIEKRSIQLINLHKKAGRTQIQQLFQGYHIEEIVFAYRIQSYYKCMCKITKMMKELRYLSQNSRASPSQNQHKQAISARSERKIAELKRLKNDLEKKQNRLSTAFVVFETQNEQKKALQYFYQSLPMKLLCKLCTCLSKSAIMGQNVTIIPAPSPEDVNWINLENPYWRTKFIRFASFFACFTLLIFGISSQVIFFRTSNSVGKIVGDISASLIILLLNFFILNFLEWTTHNIEKRETNTMIKKSLLRKLTFFMFINVSISPFLIYLYQRLIEKKYGIESLDIMSFTILIVAVGNCFKPFLSLFSIPRFVSWIKCMRQKSKREKSKLNQLEANKMFEPMDFPIQIFYSLVLTSLLMSFFYLGCFQILIVIQLPSLLFIYLIAKWMLLRVCKKPQGLSLQLNNLAQSLLRFFVPLYWVGRNTIVYLTLPSKDDSANIIDWVFARKYQQIVAASVVFFMLLCEFIVRLIAKIFSAKNPAEVSEYLIDEAPTSRKYSDANLYFQLYEEDPMDQKGLFKEERALGLDEMRQKY